MVVGESWDLYLESRGCCEAAAHQLAAERIMSKYARQLQRKNSLGPSSVCQPISVFSMNLHEFAKFCMHTICHLISYSPICHINIKNTEHQYTIDALIHTF